MPNQPSINQNLASGGLTMDGQSSPTNQPSLFTPSAPTPTPTSQSPVDQQALHLTHAIALAETHANYNKVGDNGTSIGAYQWHDKNGNGMGHFASDAKAYGLDPSDFSPENQDKVAYAKVKALKDSGYDPGQIASMWNSGNPDNWHNHSGTTVLNGKAVPYNTPAYVTKVFNNYKQLSGLNSQNGYVNPPPLDLSAKNTTPDTNSNQNNNTQDTQPQQPDNRNIFEKAGDFTKGIANSITDPFVKVIGSGVRAIQSTPQLLKGDFSGAEKTMETPLNDSAVTGQQNQKTLAGSTPLQNLGTAAQVGSYLIPGSGGLLKGALQGGVMGGLQSGGGYLAGSENPNVSDFAKNTGTGALTGAALGGLFGKLLGGGAAEESAINKTKQAYNDALGATKTGIRASSKVISRSGESPAEFLANAGLPPETAEMNGRRVFTTGPESQTYQAIQQRANDLTALRDQAIDKTNIPSSIEELKQNALDKAKQTFIGKDYQTAVDHINSEFDAFKGQPGVSDDSLKSVNTIKKYFQGNTNYDATRPSVITQANKLVGNVAKNQVESDAEKAGMPGIGQLNKIIQQHLDFLDTGGSKGILSKLNGQVIKGGKLGTYVKEGLGGVVGSGIGAGIGKLAGGGMIGELAGGAAGTVAGASIGKLASRITQSMAVGGPRIAATLGKMATENPEVVDMILNNLGRSGEKVAPNIARSATNNIGSKAGLIPKLILGATANRGKK